MNLNDRQRRFLFGGLVVLLAAAGLYLTLAAPEDDSDNPEARPSGTPSAGPTGPASPPPGIQNPVNPNDFDIYRLLPFTRQEFATAADLAQRFVAAYGTYRFDEPPETYASRISGFVTEELKSELARAASTPGVLEERRRDKIVAQGSASLDQVRNVEDNSIIFVVTGTQRVTGGGSESNDRKRYAVTVARDGGSLRVYSVQPAEAGQAGDTGQAGDRG
ncbi:conjugal transfer protein [Spirillospora sp. NBC_00431]